MLEGEVALAGGVNDIVSKGSAEGPQFSQAHKVVISPAKIVTNTNA